MRPCPFVASLRLPRQPGINVARASFMTTVCGGSLWLEITPTPRQTLGWGLIWNLCLVPHPAFRKSPPPVGFGRESRSRVLLIAKQTLIENRSWGKAPELNEPQPHLTDGSTCSAAISRTTNLELGYRITLLAPAASTADRLRRYRYLTSRE